MLHADKLNDFLTDLDIPQANHLGETREIVAAWSRLDMSRAQLLDQLGLDSRHYAYYRLAAEILGLLIPDSKIKHCYRPTGLGYQLLATITASGDEQGVFRQAIEESAALQPFCDYLLGRETVEREQVVQRICEHSDNNPTTADRRVSTLISWRSHLCGDPRDEAKQLDLFHDADVGISHIDIWPRPERFPHNRPQVRVDEIVAKDLSDSDDTLVVTGYASLGYLLWLFTGFANDRPQAIRVVLGNEPFSSNAKYFRLAGAIFSAEVRDYWLRKRISIYDSARVVAVREMIQTGRIQVRMPLDGDRGLHAKLYIGARAATIGSSNATYNGMRRQFEGNARFLQHGKERARYEETKRLAECYWKGTRDASEFILGLLHELLRPVGWRDALARACAELLEGRWASRYALPAQWEQTVPLWPSQELGIAQALYILHETGSVLIADATGSGKTRLGTHLVRSVRQHLVAHGRISPRDPVVICPPSVCDKWKDELSMCDMQLEPYSDRILSSRKALAHDRVVRAVQRSQVLVVDEAHRFLNQSERTAAMLSNAADHTLLFTATPISKSIHDLIRIINLLGADNLDDDVLTTCQELLRTSGAEALPSWTVRETAALKNALAKFVVRRTKKQLNQLVDREPSRYINQLGNICRYPEHRPHYYECKESKRDCEIASKIRILAADLRGIIRIGSVLRVPRGWNAQGRTDEQTLMRRLASAAGLARYDVASSLRSSRVALLEHLRGTQFACDQFELPSDFKPQSTGDMISRTLAHAGVIPENKLTCELPQWLREAQAHREACAQEVAIYQEIEALCGQLSDGRETAKAEKLMTLLGQHDQIVAFDSTLITLSLIQRDLLARSSGVIVFMATGAKPEQQQRVRRQFQIGAPTKRAIALCSDAMSEGIDLQSASAVVLLDMPSVVRVAEQRIGRIDRMDSPHASIDIYWPLDDPAFALTTDEKLFRRNDFVDGLMGANIELPGRTSLAPVDPAEIHDEAEKLANEEWVEDAFSPVRRLVEGDAALIEQERYEMIRGSDESIVCAVSVVRAAEPWAFFALQGTEIDTPRWVFLDSVDSPPVTSLRDVSLRLQYHLSRNPRDIVLDHHAAEQISKFVEALQAQEISLLPRRKQRALTQMGSILDEYHTKANIDEDHRRAEVTGRLLGLLKQEEPDRRVSPDELALCWLNAVRPHKQRFLQELGNARRLFLLSDLSSNLKSNPLTTEQLEQAFSCVQYTKPLGETIAAAIVGVVVSSIASPEVR